MENFRLHELPRRAGPRDELHECRRTCRAAKNSARSGRRNTAGTEDEFIPQTPMLPMNNIEAGCYKCHNASPEVPKAAALNTGRDLIRIYGCFGCHKIPGYDNIRKVGPDLSTVSGKLTKEWVRKWLANPKEFKSQARMPQFWWNSNNGEAQGKSPYWDKRNAAEINAITEYLWSKSKPKDVPAGTTSGNAGDG